MRRFCVLCFSMLAAGCIRPPAPRLPVTPGAETPSISWTINSLSEWAGWAGGLMLILAFPVGWWLGAKLGKGVAVTGLSLIVGGVVASWVNRHIGIIVGLVIVSIAGYFAWRNRKKLADGIEDVTGVDMPDFIEPD